MVALVAVGGAAGAVLARVVAAVGAHDCQPVDREIRQRLLSVRSDGGDVVSQVVTGLTAPALLVPAMFFIAYLLRRRGRAVWLPIAAAPLLAMSAGATFTRVFPRQYAPQSGGCELCFPSGHTTGLTAEFATVAYVLVRERIIGSSGVAMFMTGAAIGGVNRVYRDRHWASDILAGWSAGISVACICGLMSELLRDRDSHPHSSSR